MAKATHHSTRLSSLISDPFVRSAFERAERDLLDDGLFVLADYPPSLDSGAAEALAGSSMRRVAALVGG